MDTPNTPVEPPEPQVPPEVKSVKRPFSVTLLMIGVLIITVINLTRFVLSLRYWGFLASRSGISPLYLASSGMIWAVAGSFLIWGLWKAKSWAPRLMQAGALTYALYYWLDLLFLQDHPVSGASGAISLVLPINWQFSAGVTVVCLAYMVWTLGRSNVKKYFNLAEPETTPHPQEGDRG